MISNYNKRVLTILNVHSLSAGARGAGRRAALRWAWPVVVVWSGTSEWGSERATVEILAAAELL